MSLSPLADGRHSAHDILERELERRENRQKFLDLMRGIGDLVRKAFRAFSESIGGFVKAMRALKPFPSVNFARWVKRQRAARAAATSRTRTTYWRLQVERLERLKARKSLLPRQERRLRLARSNI